VDDWVDGFSAQLDFAKWMLGREQARIDAFHQRASYLLGIGGVILAILPTIITPISETSGAAVRTIAWILLLAVVTTLGVGISFCVVTLFTKKGRDVPVVAMQKKYVKWASSLSDDQPPDVAQLLADQANALMGLGSSNEDSTLLSIKAEADERGHRLSIAMWSSSSGIVFLAVLLCLIVIPKI